jgi:FMN-dependent NADH-azoreductase
VAIPASFAYLKAEFGFIGITDAEGVAFGPEVLERALNAAQARVDDIGS